MPDENYDNSAMSTLMGPDDSDASASAPAAKDWPPQSFDTITIRAAKDGVIVDVTRPSKPSNGPGAMPSSPEKPRLAKSPEELSSILDEAMGVDIGGDESQEQAPDESAGEGADGGDEAAAGAPLSSEGPDALTSA